MDEKPIIECPQWMKDRMEAVRNTPPPTLEEAKAQFAASKKLRSENAHCPMHKEYNPDNLPVEDDCYFCWHAYFDRHQTDESLRLFHEAMDRHSGLKD